jgi:signal transduction histidine kinase
LNRCLDNAIADAVTEFSYQKALAVERQREFAMERRIGSLAHELRNELLSATLALAALETGGLPVSGATGGVLKRALKSMTRLIHASVEEVREHTANDTSREVFGLDGLIADAAGAAKLYASTSGCALIVPAIDPEIELNADRERILAALANLLQNAFKFTAPGTDVTLSASAYGSSVHIEVSDHCGGLAHGSIERMFSPFTQRNTNRSGLGLGLSIAKQSVEADGGTLTVKNLPGRGCTFVVTLPRHRDMRVPPANE